MNGDRNATALVPQRRLAAAIEKRSCLWCHSGFALRPAPPRNGRGASLQSAVELRLGENSARKLQDLFGAAQFLDLALELLDTLRLRARDPWASALIRLCPAHPPTRVPAQPIFPAIDLIAAHWKSWSPRCSRTIRTARSSTSGENFEGLLIAPTSQGMEPPTNPVRFTMSQMPDLAISLFSDGGSQYRNCQTSLARRLHWLSIDVFDQKFHLADLSPLRLYDAVS